MRRSESFGSRPSKASPAGANETNVDGPLGLDVDGVSGDVMLGIAEGGAAEAVNGDGVGRSLREDR